MVDVKQIGVQEMTNSEFKTGLAKCLGVCGFHRVGKVFAHRDLGVLTLVDFQSSSFGKEWWINVGFWLERLGGHRPDKVEHTHLYYRLDDLFPEYRETILTAGDLAKPEQPAILVGDAKAREQRSAYQQLLELFPGRIGPWDLPTPQHCRRVC